MANDERISKTILKYEVDQSSVQRAVASVDAIDKGFVKARGNLATTSQEIKHLASEMDTLKRNTALDKLIRDAVTAGKATGDLDYKLTELEIGLRDIGANEKYIAKVTDRFKELEKQADKTAEATLKVQIARQQQEAAAARFFDQESKGPSSFSLSSLRRTGSAASQLGFGAVGEPLRLVGDLGQVEKTLEKLATSAQGANGGVLSLISGIDPMVLAMGAAALAVLDLKLVIDLLKKGAEDAAAASHAQYEQDQKAIELAEKNKQDIANKTPAQVAQELQDQADKFYHQQSEIEKLQTEIAQKQKDLAAEDARNPLFLGIGSFKHDRIQAEIDQKQKDLLDAQQRQNEAGGNFLNTGGVVQPGVAAKVAFGDLVGGMADTVKTDGKKVIDNFVKLFNDAERLTADQVKREYSLRETLNKNFTDQMEQRRKEAADAAAHEKAFREQQIQEAIKATEKYNNAVKDANEKEGEQELAAKQKYADKVASAIQKAIDDADKALEKLNQTRDNLYLGAQRDEAKAGRKDAEDDINRQIKERQQERDDLIGHLKKIRDIQKQFQSGERDALLDRNFLSLFKLQEQKKEQTSAENEAYEETKRQRAQDYQDEVQAAARSRAFERNERAIALQERLDDALRGYQHEIQLAAQARSVSIRLAAQQRDAEILLAQQKRNATLSILASQYQQELRLASLTSQARLQIFANELIQARQMGFQLGLSQAISETSPYSSPGTNGINIKRFAEGGTFGPGTFGIYNDGYPGQRENINGVRMPPGIGLFVSSAAGTVTDSGAHIGSLSMPIHIHESHNPQATYRVAKQAVVDGFNQVIRR